MTLDCPLPAAQGHLFELHDPKTGAVARRASAVQFVDAVATADGGAASYGRFGDKYAIKEFFELCWITAESEPDHDPI